MRKHQVNILLLEIIKTCAFWQDTTDKFMGDLDSAFLIGSTGVAIENETALLTVLVTFNRNWVAEFTATVCKNHRE